MSDSSTRSVGAVPALLPVHALRGWRIGISVSDSADLARLGLTKTHFKLALRELARTVLVGGGTLAYGGHLLPGGFTEFLIVELGQYARTGLFAKHSTTTEVPLLVCLSNQEHRHCSLDELDNTDRELGLHGELRCIDLHGAVMPNPASNRGPEGEPYPADRTVLAQGLTALRHYMTSNTSARMLLGGKRHQYSGLMPGVVEEALMALRADQPLYLAAGFGGATLDMAAAIDARCADLCPGHISDPPLNTETLAAIDDLKLIVEQSGWRRLNNGLDDDENLHLAVTHRPSEIAALVALGLGRLAQRKP